MPIQEFHYDRIIEELNLTREQVDKALVIVST